MDRLKERRDRIDVLKIWIHVLTFLCGYLDLGGILTFTYGVTHHSGNVVHVARALYEGDQADLKRLLLIVLSFFAGSFVSGLIFHQRRLEPKRRYGIILTIGALGMNFIHQYFGSVLLLYYYTAFFAGLQNGMFIFYQKMLVRTSHITGYLTDAGFNLGILLRDPKNQDVRAKTSFYIASVFFFFLGAYAGSATFFNDVDNYYQVGSMIYMLAGLFYFVVRDHQLKELKK